MKTKMFINPFERIAGWQALFIGLVVMSLTAVVGKINHVAFDGVLDVHKWATFSFSTAFAMQAVNFLALFLTMWLAGICFSTSKLRVIDVAGTMALARAPMLLLAIICFLPVVPERLFDMPRVIIFSLTGILFVIWMVALMYNAYSVSCHLKGSKAILSFIGALLVAEIVSKLIFIFLLNSLFVNSPTTACISDGTSSVENSAYIADIRQKTENVVRAFEKSEFETITVYFNETMKKKLPSKDLKILWAQLQLEMAFGKFEKADMDGLKETSIDKYYIIDVPFFFAKETIRLRLFFNEDEEISGLFFQPIK